MIRNSIMAFEFLNVGRIIVERGGIRRLGEWAGKLGKCALVVHNADPAIEAVLSSLRAAAVTCEIYRHRGEPTIHSVQAALDLAKAGRCDLVVGLGGGSAIDAAKAVAALLTNGGEPLDYMEIVGQGRQITRPAAPWIAVPTTAGTGAEATRNAVVAAPEKRYKASIRSEYMLARIALVDAQLAATLPPPMTAAAGADALCQLIESYTSLRANPLSDALALQGVSLAAKSLQKVYDHGDDLDAREQMAIASLLSGITLANAGLGVVHGLAAPMGGAHPIPHGVICAALLPHAIRVNVAALRQRQSDSPALDRYAAIGRILTDRPMLSPPAAIDAGVEFIQRLTAHMRIPALRQFGLTEEGLSPTIAKAQRSSSIRTNPISLTDDELRRIVEAGI